MMVKKKDKTKKKPEKKWKTKVIMENVVYKLELDYDNFKRLLMETEDKFIVFKNVVIAKDKITAIERIE